jgi:S1-C subfamily serine protease
VRFQNGPTSATAANPTGPYAFGSGPQAFGPAVDPQMQWIHKKKKKKFSGMTWLFIGLLLFFVAAGAFTAIVRDHRGLSGVAVAEPPRAYAGVDQFKNGDGGVTFDNVEPPGAPADTAGLLGGDLITSFDGHAVKTSGELTDLLRQSPIGKPVEVVYTRDGEIKKTLLTPIGREELRQLERAFSRRPEGLGRFGYDNGDSERVLVPGTNNYGVQLGQIATSLPADMAGIKQGDIVIEFDKIPIRTPGELESRVKRAIPYQPVTVVIMRDGQRLEIPVKMGKQ